MATARRPGGKMVAGVLLFAGVAAIVGAFLTWIDLSSAGISFADGSVSADPNGVDTTYGWVAVGGGVILTFAALMLLRVRSRAFGVLAILAAVAVGGVCGFVAATPEERFIDYAVDTAATETFRADDVRREMETLYVQNAVQVTPGVGLPVSAAGAFLGLLAGIGLLARTGTRPSAGGGATSHDIDIDIDVDQRLAAVLGRDRSTGAETEETYPETRAPGTPAVIDEVREQDAPDGTASDGSGTEQTRRSTLGDSWSA